VKNEDLYTTHIPRKRDTTPNHRAVIASSYVVLIDNYPTIMSQFHAHEPQYF